jgi:hypothetical protein
MHLQYISDPTGEPTAVIIPIEEWKDILDTHNDLKQLASVHANKSRSAMSLYKGILSKERGEALLQHVEQSRNEWDRNS